MKVQRLAGPGETNAVSFEFFPPKTAEMEAQLWNAIRRLAPLRPHFVSVTYGAGGSTRDRTHSTVKRIVDETALKPAAHLTCVGAPRAEIDTVIREYWNAGVRHIVALRGDMAASCESYKAHGDGYQSTAELVSAIRDCAFRSQRLRLSRETPGFAVRRMGHCHPETENRRRRDARDHAIRLRLRRLRALSRARAESRHKGT